MKVHVMAMVVLLGSIMLMPVRLSAQEATPAASPVAEAQLGDLPALMMTVADLEAAGQHDSKTYSGDLYLTPAGYINGFGFDPATADVASEALSTAGFLGGVTTWWQIADQESGQPIRQITTYLERYASPAGAAAGFAAIEAASVASAPATQIFVDDQSIGDHIQIIGVGGQTFSGTPGAGTPAATAADAAVWRDVLVQTGPLNAGVTVSDYTGQAPTITEMEALAETFLARIEIEQEHASPGLAMHSLRPAHALTSFSGYYRRDGTTLQFSDETNEEWQRHAAAWEAALAVYRHDVYVPFGAEGYDDDIFISNRIARFPDEQTAAAFMADLPGVLQADEGTVRERDLELGDETVVADGETTSATGEVAYRAWVFSRAGADVTRVFVEKHDVAPSLIGVEALAAAALHCLDSTDWCPTVQVPTELLAVATTGTPVEATPVPSIAGTPEAGTANASCAERVAQDRAALVLTPGDLDAVGLSEFGARVARSFSAEEDIAFFADLFDRDMEEVRALVTDAGGQGSYGVHHVFPEGTEPAPATWPARVTSIVHVFADSTGAGDVLALVPGESADETVEEITLSAPIGDEARLTRLRVVQASPTAGAPQALALWFRYDCVLVDLELAIDDPESVAVPPVATIEALAQRLIARIDNVLAGRTAGLDGPRLRVQTGTEGNAYAVYEKLDGETIRGANQSDRVFLDRVLEWAGYESLLDHDLTLPGGGAEAADDRLLNTTLVRFSDEEAASSWLRRTVDRYATIPGFSGVEELSGVPQFGDESIAVALAYDDGDRSFVRDNILVRVGTVVALIYLEQSPVEADRQDIVQALMTLAAAQVACLEQSGLCAPIPEPAGLAPPVATPAA